MKVLSHAVILDDHRLFADSFRTLLQKEYQFDVVQAFSDTEDFFRFIRAFGRGDIYVFMDYYFPKDNGLALLVQVRQINPKAKIIVVTSALSATVIRTISQYSPNAMLSKSSDTIELTACIEALRRDKTYLAPEFKQLLEAVAEEKEVTFSPRELELLTYFSKGYNIAQTAKETFLSPHTVVAHRRKMMAKAKCNNIGQLLTYAQQNDLI